ncbi:peptidase inhibitor family I36 protein [Streptomyces lydicus]
MEKRPMFGKLGISVSRHLGTTVSRVAVSPPRTLYFPRRGSEPSPTDEVVTGRPGHIVLNRSRSTHSIAQRIRSRSLFRKREKAFASFAVALVLGAVGSTPPAQAASRCPEESLCSYSGPGLSGDVTVIPASHIEKAGADGVKLPTSARSFANGTHFTLRYGPARRAICVRFPCYQYATLGKIAPGAQLPSLPHAERTLTVGRDFGN